MSLTGYKYSKLFRGLFITTILFSVLFAFFWVITLFGAYWGSIPTSSETGFGAYINYGSIEIFHYQEPVLDSYFGMYYWGFVFDARHLWEFTWMEESFGTFITFPLWAPMFFFIVCSIALATFAHRKHPSLGCCSTCGYDLRGSQESSTCPECGEAIVREKQS